MTRPQPHITSALPRNQSADQNSQIWHKFPAANGAQEPLRKARCRRHCYRKQEIPSTTWEPIPALQLLFFDADTNCSKVYLDNNDNKGRLRWLTITGVSAPSDQSEKANRLTGPIFVPGMTTNWFQQEAMVRHVQSDAGNRWGSGLRNQQLVG